MYLPKYFAPPDDDALWSLIDSHNFAPLISQSKDGLTATPLPFLPDRPRNCLRSHMARANPHWQSFTPETEVLILFQGPHAYISPTWYETKDAVPTWNYVTVHAHGRPRLLTDEAETLAVVSDTVRKHEPQGRYTTDTPSPTYLKTLLKGIVAFEIHLTRLEGKWKLGQNRPIPDHLGAVAGLRATGQEASLAVADLMHHARNPSPNPA